MDYKKKLAALKDCGVSIKSVADKAGLSHVAILKQLKNPNLEFTQDSKNKLDKAFLALQQEINNIQKILKGED